MRLFLAIWTFAAALLPAAPASYQSAFYFEPNRGQAAADVRFLASGGDLAILVHDRAITTSLSGRTLVRMELVGSSAPSKVAGVQPLPGISNYLDRQPNITQVPHFSAVRLDRVYPGIDLLYKADRSQFEYDFYVAPGANPSAIRLRFSSLPRLSPEGDLLLDTPSGVLRQHRPIAFQTIQGQRQEVPVKFRLRGHQVSFALAPYDRSHALTIDPPITYLTYLGNPNRQIIITTKTDGSGALYLFTDPGIVSQTAAIGTTASMMVTKFGPTGQLVYSTRLDIEPGRGAAVDSSGFVYLAGTTLPLGTTVFSKLNQAGTAEVFRRPFTFTNTNLDGIAVDANSNIYLAGSTFGDPTNFTATPGAFQSSGKGFFTKYSPDGLTSLLRTFTPDDNSFIGDVLVDSAGALYFSAITPSIWPPSINLSTGTSSGDTTVFVKLKPDFTGLDYIFRFAGTSLVLRNLALDSANNLFFSGSVQANEPSFGPLSNSANSDVVNNVGLVKVNSTGSALLFARSFGGSGNETPLGLAIDPAGNAWVGGVTDSTNLPLVGATQNSRNGITDGFLAQIKGDGAALLFSTYVGSTAAEFYSGEGVVAADGTGAYLALVAGPGTLASVNAIQPTFTGSGFNLIVGKWGTNTPVNATPSVTSSAPVFGSGTTATRTFVFTDTNGSNDLGVVNVLINSALDGRNACYIAYDSAANLLVLLTDPGDNATVLALPSNASLNNSQCSIAGSSITAVKFANTLTLTVTFNFTASFTGSRVFFAAARDTALANSGWVTVGTQTITIPATNPRPLSVTPSSGTTTVGATYTVTAQYRDATASTNLQPVQVLINADLNGFNSCYFGFDHLGNNLYIVGDDGNLQPTPARLNGAAGGAATIENTQCRLISAGSTFTDSGTTLTLTLQLQFKSGFLGRKLIFNGAQTTGGANSGWSVLGSLIVQ